MDKILVDISKERVLWKNALKTQYETGETDILFFQSLDEVFGFNKLKALLEIQFETTEIKKTVFDSVLNRLVSGEPIQYIFGYTEFYGRKFKVGPGVLIPRPETEELVEWVLEDLYTSKQEKKPIFPTLLDIGTGSGCIPISISLESLEIQAWGIDISEPALKIAFENKVSLDSKVRFLEGNILKDLENTDLEFNIFPQSDLFKIGDGLIPKEWDYIISNPPYIPFSDRDSLSVRVKEYEPSLALFVPNQNPLLFYDTIFRFAKRYLKKDGKLYFEIHDRYQLEIKDLGEKYQFPDFQVRLDIRGKARMLRFMKG